MLGGQRPHWGTERTMTALALAAVAEGDDVGE
jgi:hypothetical protein